MTVFFTADTHFGHAGALRLYRRPFASVAEMDAAMIDRWNATIEDTDVIWHLGDFSKHLALPAAAERRSRAAPADYSRGSPRAAWLRPTPRQNHDQSTAASLLTGLVHRRRAFRRVLRPGMKWAFRKNRRASLRPGGV